MSAPHAEKLFDAITQAGTAEELNRAGGKAEGFVLGLESTKAIKSQIAESLYVAYDDAASQRATRTGLTAEGNRAEQQFGVQHAWRASCTSHRARPPRNTPAATCSTRLLPRLAGARGMK